MSSILPSPSLTYSVILSPQSGFTPATTRVGVGELAEIARIAVVIEDHFPIQLLQLIHGKSPRLS